MLAIALLAWLGCFCVLEATGAWTTFAPVGVGLAAIAIASGAVSERLLRPSWVLIVLGVVGGACMVLITHLAFFTIARLTPSVATATRELFTLLNVPNLSPFERVPLITATASCEEVLFRGLLPCPEPTTVDAAGVARAKLHRAIAVTAAYALTTVPLGSPLLTACALVCGSAWAGMRIMTGSIVVPLLAHTIWDLGVLLLWPLA